MGRRRPTAVATRVASVPRSRPGMPGRTATAAATDTSAPSALRCSVIRRRSRSGPPPSLTALWRSRPRNWSAGLEPGPPATPSATSTPPAHRTSAPRDRPRPEHRPRRRDDAPPTPRGRNRDLRQGRGDTRIGRDRTIRQRRSTYFRNVLLVGQTSGCGAHLLRCADASQPEQPGPRRVLGACAADGRRQHRRVTHRTRAHPGGAGTAGRGSHATFSSMWSTDGGDCSMNDSSTSLRRWTCQWRHCCRNSAAPADDDAARRARGEPQPVPANWPLASWRLPCALCRSTWNRWTAKPWTRGWRRSVGRWVARGGISPRPSVCRPRLAASAHPPG